MKKILLLDGVDEIFYPALSDLGYELVEDFQSRAVDIRWDEYSGLLMRSRLSIDKAILDAAPKLEFIARVGSGLEHIDCDYAAQKGVKVLSAPEGNRDAVGEHAIALTLNLLNHLNRADRQVREGRWSREENRGRELGAMTVGIIGFGHMGSSLAQKLRGFGCRILAFDKYKQNYAPAFVEEVSLAELQAQADLVSLHLPLTEETHHYLSPEFIAGMTKPFYLINTARGNQVSIPVLLQAMAEGKILGAGLDVLEYEKSSFEELERDQYWEALVASDQVVLSPHVAGWTAESKLRLAQVLIDKIKALTT